MRLSITKELCIVLLVAVMTGQAIGQTCYDSNCLTCSSSSFSDCTICKDGYYVFVGCSKCSVNNCKKCSFGFNNCSECMSGYTLNTAGDTCSGGLSIGVILGIVGGVLFVIIIIIVICKAKKQVGAIQQAQMSMMTNQQPGMMGMGQPQGMAFGQPQPGFGQPQSGFGQPQPGFGQPQSGFGGYPQAKMGGGFNQPPMF